MSLKFGRQRLAVFDRRRQANEGSHPRENETNFLTHHYKFLIKKGSWAGLLANERGTDARALSSARRRVNPAARHRSATRVLCHIHLPVSRKNGIFEFKTRFRFLILIFGFPPFLRFSLLRSPQPATFSCGGEGGGDAHNRETASNLNRTCKRCTRGRVLRSNRNTGRLLVHSFPLNVLALARITPLLIVFFWASELDSLK